MKHYSQAVVERTMKVQEVIMWAMARKITWYEAAEIVGLLPANETVGRTLVGAWL